MKELKDSVCCCVDRGTFYPVAERLARDYATVYYCKPDGESFETVAQARLGHGQPKVILLDDFWPFTKETTPPEMKIDLFVFPDCRDAGLQLELESQGFPVWGSKTVSSYETMRGQWLRLCKELDLPMPKTLTIKGLTNLRLFLREHADEHQHVKISQFRGDMETWQDKSREGTENKLDVLAAKWGPVKEEIVFYVQENLDTDIESGADTYNVHGQFPDEVIIGYEKKGESYFAAVRKASDMAPVVWGCMEAIRGVLKEGRYANFISSEVRVKDDKGYWLDPCFRAPSPAGEEQLEMYENFGEIVWAGAHGELVQPKWAAKFCGEAVISYCGDREGWKSITVPEEVRQWVKLYANIGCDGAFHFPPGQDPEAIGCAVGMGDKPEDVVDQLKEIAEALKDSPVELNIEPMADLFKEIEKAEAEGIEFSEEPVPDPASVLEDKE